MINILPIEEKAKYKRIYGIRVFTLAIYFLVALLVLGGVFLAPSYILSEMKEGIAEERLDKVKAAAGETGTESLDAIIGDINTKLKVFPDDPVFTFSKDVILPILSKKTAEISITSISYSKTTDGKLGISISGKALNRDALLSFERDLETEPTFSGVALPISNFIKDKDIEFIIQFAVVLK